MERTIIDIELMDNVLDGFRSIKNNIYIDSSERVLQNKKRLENEYEKRQKMIVTRLKEYDKKIKNVQNQHAMMNNVRIKVNRQRDQQIKLRLQELKTQERLNRIKLIKHIKKKEIKAQKLLVDIRNIRLREKQNKDIDHYNNQFKHQSTTIPENQLIIEKCIKKKSKLKNIGSIEEWSLNEEIKNEPQEEIIVEEECFIDSDQSVS